MKTKIDRLQYFFLIPNLLYAKAIGFTAGVVTRHVGADNWTAMLIGFVIATAAFVLMTFISSKFPDRTIVQYINDTLGKFASTVIGVILSVCFGIAFITSANTVGIHLKEYLLIETPYLVLVIVYTLLCIYGVYLGIEVVIRYSFFAVIMIIILNVSMVFGIVNFFDISNLQPFFDRGIMKNIEASVFTFSDSFMAILAVGFIYPMLKNKKKSISLSVWSMALAIVLIIVWPITETGVMGADVMKQYVVVCMQQARTAQLTQYMPRYELIMVVFFIWGAFVQSAVMLHCSFYSLKQGIGFKKDWFYFAALGVLLVTGTYYFGHDHNYFTGLLTRPWPQIAAGISIGLPILLLPLVLMKKKVTS